MLALLMLVPSTEAAASEARVLRNLPASARPPYRAMIAAPRDIPLIFAAARALEDAGIHDEALTLYRRVLIIDGRVDAARIAIAALQMRLGNPVAALAELDAVDADGLTPADRRILRTLRREAGKQVSTHRFDATARFGLRLQTNASRAPEDGPLLTFEDADGSPGTIATVEQTLPRGQRARDDVSAVFDLAASHRYDPGAQEAVVFETNAAVRLERHLDVRAFDNLLASADAGPRVPARPADPVAGSIRPFVHADLQGFDGELYAVAPGVGVSARARAAPRVDVAALLTAGYRFHGPAADTGASTSAEVTLGDTVTVPSRDGDERDGAEIGARFGATWRFSQGWRVDASPFLDWRDADTAALRRTEIGLSASVRRQFAVDAGDGVASVGLSAGYGFAWYAEPDPQVSPDDRRDHRLRARLFGEHPFSGRGFVFGSVGYAEDISSISNYDRRNLDATLGIGLRF